MATIVKRITVGVPIRSVAIAGNDLNIAGDTGSDTLNVGTNQVLTFVGGDGIETTVTDNTVTFIAGEATTTTRGAASFDSDHFTVNAGAVSLKLDGIDATLVDFGTGTNQISTSDLPEGTKLYYEDYRVRGAISASGDLSYDSDTGVFSFDVEQVYTKANFDSDWNLAMDEATIQGSGLAYDSSTNTLRIDSAELAAEFLPALGGSLIPDTDSAYDLGSATNKWRDLYLSGGTIYIGDVQLKDSSGGLAAVDSNGSRVALGAQSISVSSITADSSTITNIAVTQVTSNNVTADSANIATLTAQAGRLNLDSAHINAISTPSLTVYMATIDSAHIPALTSGTVFTNNITVNDSAYLNRTNIAKLTSDSAHITFISSTNLDVDSAFANTINVETLDVDNATIDSATITNLSATTLTFNNITVDSAHAVDISIETAQVDSATIDNLATTQLTANNATFDSANIDTLYAGTVTIFGNLQVDGTTTTVNSTEVSIDDKVVVIGANASDSSQLQGAGIILGDSDTYSGTDRPEFTYDAVTNRWTMNKVLVTDFVGNVTGNVVGNVTGNVTGQVSDISNHTTDDLAEGNNEYYTRYRFDSALGDATSQATIFGYTKLGTNNGSILSYDSSTGNFTFNDSNVARTDIRDTYHNGLRLPYNQSIQFIGANPGAIARVSIGAGDLTLQNSTGGGQGNIVVKVTESSQSNFEVYKGNTVPMIMARGDSAVELYFNGVMRLETQDSGARVVGLFKADSADITNITIDSAVVSFITGSYVGYDSGYIKQFEADSAHLGQFGADSGHLNNASILTADIDSADIAFATGSYVGYDSGHIKQFSADSAHLGQFGADSGHLNNASILTADIDNATLGQITIDSAYATQLNIVTGDIDQVTADSATITNVSITAVRGNLVPAVDSAYDLGTTSAKWRDLHLSGSSIFLGNVVLKDNGGSLEITNTSGTNVDLTAGIVTADSGVITNLSADSANIATLTAQAGSVKFDSARATDLSGVRILGDSGTFGQILFKDDFTDSHISFQEGAVWYDPLHKNLNYYADIDHPIEIGMQMVERVYNNTGSEIPKGAPLYYSGNYTNDAGQESPTVALADATSPTAYNVQGLAGEPIANGSYGLIVVAGVIDGFDTSGLTAGQNFFAGLTPGAVQNAAPTYPNYPMCLGWVIKSDATDGKVIINQQNHSVNTFRVKGDTHIGADLRVDGDLTVVGSQIVTSTENVSIGGNIQYLNSGNTIGQSGTTFVGTGLDDAFYSGHYSGDSATKSFFVKIDATGTPDTFEWGFDSSVGTEATGVAITGEAQLLDSEYGISIDFGATTGHTTGDKWTGTATAVDIDTGIFSNRHTGTDYTHVGLFFDVSENKWTFLNDYEPEPETTINLSAAGTVLGAVKAASFEGDLTGDVTGNANTATLLETGRNFSISGDGSAPNVSFNGSGAVDLVLTLDSVNTGVGSFGSASQVPVITVNNKGLVTAVSTVAVAGVSSINYDSSNGNFQINTADGGTFVETITLDPFTTTDLTEGTNEYYTRARFDSALGDATSTATIRGYFTANKGLSVASGEFNIDSANVKNMFAGDKGLAYNSSTGTFDIDSANVKNMFAGDKGLSYSDGTFNIDSDNVKAMFSGTSGRITYNSSTGNITIPNSGVTAGVYGSASLVPVLTIDSDGRVDSAGTVSVAGVSSTSFDSATGVFTINTADGGSYATHVEKISAGTGVSYDSATGIITSNDGQIVHDNLSGFVANEHIDHSGITVTAGTGLNGGGTIELSRTINIDSSEFLTYFNSSIDHDVLTNFVANEHIDHTSVSITAGTGLTGGGTIAATRDLAIDSSEFLTYFNSSIDHDVLTNFVANEHIDHTSVSITAGFGLAGGGTIAATRDLRIDSAEFLSYFNSSIVHDDLSGFVANEHIDHSTVSITAGTGLSGGGTIAATRNLAIDSAELNNYFGGAGKGFDADTLDGQEGSYYRINVYDASGTLLN